jgi:hypothetical protein
VSHPVLAFTDSCLQALGGATGGYITGRADVSDACHLMCQVSPETTPHQSTLGLLHICVNLLSLLLLLLNETLSCLMVPPSQVVALLRQRARPYLFSNTLAPCVAGAGIKARVGRRRRAEGKGRAR